MKYLFKIRKNILRNTSVNPVFPNSLFSRRNPLVTKKNCFHALVAQITIL